MSEKEIVIAMIVVSFLMGICLGIGIGNWATRRLLEMNEQIMRTADDSECICRGNWRKIVAQTEPLMGRHYSSVTGAEFTLEGLVHTEEDYYYGMRDIKTGRWELLSCVGSIEGHGFIAITKAEAK